jgi:hypothetical protein
MTTRFSTLLLLVACTACSTVKVSGRTAAPLASTQMHAGGIVVRPTELSWTIAGPATYTTSLRADELEGVGGVTPGVFFTGGTGLPAHVRLAASQAVAERDADGILLTHYTVTEQSSASTVRYDVQLFGRYLTLAELEVIDGDRADHIEGLELRLQRAVGDSAVVDPKPALRSPVPLLPPAPVATPPAPEP